MIRRGGEKKINSGIDNDKKDDRNDTSDDVSEPVNIVIDVVRIFSKISHSEVHGIGGVVNIKFCFKEFWNVDCGGQ